MHTDSDPRWVELSQGFMVPKADDRLLFAASVMVTTLSGAREVRDKLETMQADKSEPANELEAAIGTTQGFMDMVVRAVEALLNSFVEENELVLGDEDDALWLDVDALATATFNLAAKAGTPDYEYAFGVLVGPDGKVVEVQAEQSWLDQLQAAFEDAGLGEFFQAVITEAEADLS